MPASCLRIHATQSTPPGHIVTAGTALLKSSAAHPQTDKSVEGFLSDFEKWLKQRSASTLTGVLCNQTKGDYEIAVPNHDAIAVVNELHASGRGS